MKVLYLHSYFDYLSHLLFFYTLPYKKCAFFTLLPIIVKKIFQRPFLKNGRCRVLWRDLRCQGLDQQGPQGLGSFSDQGPK